MSLTYFHFLLTLFFLALFIFVSTGLGMLVLRKVGISFIDFGELFFFSIGTGFGVLGYSIFVLGSFQLLRPQILYGLLGSLTALSLLGWFGGRPLPAYPTFNLREKSLLEQSSALFLLFALLAGMILVLTPETGKDALIYHLAVPKLFLKHQGFYFIPGNIFANYPLFNEMLFLAGLFIQGEVLAKGMHFVALLGILLGIRQFSGLPKIENPFPFLSSLIFLTIPSVFITSHSAYNDLFITYYSMAAVLAFIHWFQQRSDRWLVVSGIFSGLAVASKYTALLLPILGCLGILWASSFYREKLRQAGRSLFIFLTSMALLGAPFYIKNWLVTGNPFYPFLYQIFGGRGWDPDQARLYETFVRNLGLGRDFWDYLLLPWNLSFQARLGSPRFDGLLGPIFLLTLPFLIGVGRLEKPVKIFCIYCAFTFLFWASSAQQIRYLIPIFPFLSLLTGIILAKYKKQQVLWILLSFLIIGSIFFNSTYIIRHFEAIKPIGVVIGTEDRDSFLSRRLPSYGMFNYINKNLPGNSKLFLIYMRNWGFLLDRDYYSDSMFESYTIQKILSESQSTGDINHALRSRGFTHLFYDQNYIYRGLSTFSSEEKEKFLNFQKKYLSLIKKEEPYYLFRLN